MEKKYKIKFNNEYVSFESEKELKEFKKQYNGYRIMFNKQFNEGIAIRDNGIIDEPQIMLRDVLMIVKQQGTAITELQTSLKDLFVIVKQQGEMINNLALEMREGFRKVNERLDKHEAILMRHEEILMRHEEILIRHEEIFKRNNLS